MTLERDPAPDVVPVEDPQEISRRLREACDAAKVEVLSLVPAGTLSVQNFRESLQADTDIISRGLSCKLLYHADVVNSPAIMKFLESFTSSGAEIRMTRAIPHRAVLIDRRLAVVPQVPGGPGGAALFVTQPVMVASFVAQFTFLWKSAHLVGGVDNLLNVTLIRETVDLLRSGITDDVAARQLNVSVRTMRRRVAAVLELLGATSRFEAGVKASEAGWI